MTQNPYYPQQPAMPHGPVSKPATLVWAVRGMYAGAILSLIGAVSTLLFRGQIEEAVEEAAADARAEGVDLDVDMFVNFGLVVGIGVSLLAAALWVWMAVMNDRGRNWARITGTVFGAISLCGTPMNLAQPTITGPALVQSLLTLALVVTILVLLWMPATSAYFKAQSATPRGY